jgi:hypothetical protein
MTVAYRNLDAVIEERIERFRARRAEERTADDAVRRVFAARVARIAAGGAGAAAGLAMFAKAGMPFSGLGTEGAALNTYFLVGAWVAAWMCGAVAWTLARRYARLELQREPLPSGDTRADLAQIDAADPLGAMRATLVRWETRSTAWPLAAAALLVPLTLHGMFAVLAYWSAGSTLRAEVFGGWISASAALVGLAHLALLVQLVFWARSLRERATEQLRQGIHRAWGRTLAVTTGVGLLPALIFVFSGEAIVFLPAILVAVTGVAFIPFLFIGTARCLERERAALALAGPGA